MRVSKTELNALLKQAFEGLGFNSGEYEYAADMVVWAEMSGLQGLQELHRGLPYLIEHSGLPIQCVWEDGANALMDAGNSSSLNCAEVVLDMAYVKALKQGFSSVTVRNCHNRKLFMKAVMECGRRDVSALVYWRNSSAPVIEHVISIGPGTTTPLLPRYRTRQMVADSNIEIAQRQSLFIVCSTQVAKLDEHESDFFSQSYNETTLMEPDTLRGNYRAALNQGLVIKEALWERLQALSKKVLVESSEQSRMGAGA